MRRLVLLPGSSRGPVLQGWTEAQAAVLGQGAGDILGMWKAQSRFLRGVDFPCCFPERRLCRMGL